MSASSQMTNQQKQDFPVDAILGPAESLRGGKNLQDQIADAPVDAFHVPTIQWDGYATSMAQQAAFGALSNARVEAMLAIQNGLFRQVLDVLGSMQNGVQIDIDYDRLEAAVDKAVADAMPTNFPEYELTRKDGAK